jgi:hypothetical protein
VNVLGIVLLVLSSLYGFPAFAQGAAVAQAQRAFPGAGAEGAGRAPTPSVKSWGAVGNGVADDSAVIATAIGDLAATGGGCLYFPPGTYVVHITVRSQNICLQGAGRNVTKLVWPSPTESVVSFVSAKKYTFWAVIKDMTIASTAPRPRAGAALHIERFASVLAQNLTLSDTYNGEEVIDAGVVKNDNVDVSTIWNDGFKVDGTPNVFFDSTTVFQNRSRPGRASYEFVAAQGAHLTDCTGQGSDYGLLVDPPAGRAVFDLFIENCDFDTNQAAAAKFDGSAGKIYDIKLSTSRYSFAEGPGLWTVGPNTHDITSVGDSFGKNLQEGIRIDDCRNCQFDSAKVLGNFATGAPSGKVSPGIALNGGDGIFFRGGASGPYPTAGNNQTHGVAVARSFKGLAVVTAMDLRGNTEAPFVDRSRSPNVDFRGNVNGPLQPTIGRGACGEHPAMAPHSTDRHGTVTAGVGKFTSCTLTWGYEHVFPPDCTWSSPTGATLSGFTARRSGLELRQEGGIPASAKFSWHCGGE